MNFIDPPTTNARSWRDIPQQVKPRAMSSEGRRRMTFGLFRTILAVAALGALAWGGYETVVVLQGQAPHIGGTPASVVKDVVFSTDGVLNRRWIVETLALPKDAALMDLDLFQLRSRLLASGQVQSAELTRNFPSTLTVHLLERSPVVRVMAQVAGEAPKPLLVARDGVVFAGAGFDPAMLATLPWLDGVKLTRDGEHFQPIPRMDVVAELLGKAKLEAEHLYRTWQVVSLARLDSDGEILVKSGPVETIRFSVTEDYFRQLARLDALLDKVRERTDEPLREVNLAIGSQVPASFDDPALSPTPAKPGAKPAAKPAAPVAPALTLFTPPSYTATP